MSAAALVGTFINDNVEAPLYRLPRSVFDTCHLQLLADGAISPDEIKTLTGYFNEIETLNRANPKEYTEADLEAFHERIWEAITTLLTLKNKVKSLWG